MPVFRNEDGKFEAFDNEDDELPYGTFDTEKEAYDALDELEDNR